MKNRDMPMSSELKYERFGDIVHSESSGGLTKREHAAIAAMQGLLASGCADYHEANSTADAACRHASALFDELESGND